MISDFRVNELSERVHEPQNLVSYHLHRLLQYQLVQERHSTADKRQVFYSLDHERLRMLYFASGAELSPAMDENLSVISQKEDFVNPIRVLFLCTHNSARSQMAEGILRARAGNQVEVFSAGTEPSTVHPLAIRSLAEIMQIDISHQRSKNLEQFIGQEFDYIVTVCDRAKESCPIFPGDPVQIHLSFPDPSDVEGSESERYEAFKQIAVQMNTRISYLMLMIARYQKDERGM